MDSEFWGCVIPAGRAVRVEVATDEEYVHVSQAALGADARAGRTTVTLAVADDAEASGAAAAGGDDNRGAESWLTAIEEVDVSVERRMQNIEETERAKRAMLDGARPGELGAFDALKPSHMELKEAKKRPPPSETALARRQFVTGFGAKRERQEASEESRREKERRKNFFKKKRNKR